MAPAVELAGKVYTSISQQASGGRSGNDRMEMNVAVALAILFLLNQVYDCVFIIIEVALYVYKCLRLPYEASDIGLEAALLALFIILDVLRFAFGKRGNLTQRVASLGLALLLTPAVLMIGLHVMLWQTYVTWADYILGAILISFHAAEFVMLLLAIILRSARRSERPLTE